MELSDLVPLKERKKEGWVIKSGYLMYRKLNLIPLAFISEDDTVWIILDHRIKNKVISLISHLVKNNIQFLCTIEEITNPSGAEDVKENIINHYLNTYIDTYFSEKFKEIEFDIFDVMIKWSEKEKCNHLLKQEFDYFIKQLNRKSLYDDKYKYIAEDIKSIWRQIQISQILS
jgi:predicted nucleic acid-binding Zn finger protein